MLPIILRFCLELTDVLKITMFPLGGFLIVSKDFDGPDVESEEVREMMHIRRQRMITNAALSLRRLMRPFGHRDGPCDVEVAYDFEKKDTDTVSCDETVVQTQSMPVDEKTLTGRAPTPTDSRFTCCNHLVSRLLHVLKELLRPTPIVIVFAIVIALIDPLKALFLPPSSSFNPRFRPVGPDGRPPLAFVLDTASFVGASCVPIGLICLGSALSCLRVRSGEPFPRGAIASLALAKMVVTPLIGIGITRWFAHAGFVNRDDKVLQFVCM